MKIALLLQREDFGAILEKTLSRYLSTTTGDSYTVKWYPRNPGVRTIRCQGMQPWLCNSLIDMIVAPRPDRTVIQKVRSWYGQSHSRWRTLAYSMYVTIATCYPGIRFLSQHALGVNPALPHESFWAIRGGINRIRLMDFYHREIHVLLKAGLSPERIRSEIAVRRELPIEINVPELLSVADDGSYYTEEFVDGISLDQLASELQRQHVSKIIYNNLLCLCERTVDYIPLPFYLDRLSADIEGFLVSNRLLTVDQQRSLKQIVQRLTKGLNDLPQAESLLIPVSLSHGDPQDANILWDGQNAWLIDWEFASPRLWLCDSLVFALRLRGRRIHGLGLQLSQWEPRHTLTPFPEINQVLIKMGQDNRLWEQHVLGKLFLLEQIRYFLNVDDNSLLTCPDLTFHWFPDECAAFIEHMS